MNILIIGSGGREHALAWKIKQSKKVEKLFIAPGNAGTAELGTNVAIGPDELEKIKEFVLNNNIRIVVVGPEEPLVKGFHDFFVNDKELQSVKVIGPQKQGAKLEGSKDFAKEFMLKYNIPTARYLSITEENLPEGFDFLKKLIPPYVLKADGLAAGKGVVILNDMDEAKAELKEMLEGKFGEASKKVVIEEYLSGIELSAFVITDGKSYKILPEAKDYKRIGEGDTGLNTGGMGAVSPVPFAGKEFMDKVEEKIIKPTVFGLQNENIPYKGFIFFGLINVNGEPLVIEYNVRLGDPETEVILPRIKSDFVDLLEGVAEGNLVNRNIEIENRTVTTVMLVSKGYPGHYEKGKVISGLDKTSDSIVFHAGTKPKNGKSLTNGGRVIAISSFGENKIEALLKSYRNAEIINFDGKYYRKDIGFDL